MKYFIPLIIAAFCFASCENKTVTLLSRRWDYDKIENVDTAKHRFLSAEDSVAEANMRTAMQLLSWTFKKNKTYQCAVGNRIATEGNYSLSGDNVTLTMTPTSQKTQNIYNIKLLTENQLVLSGASNEAIVTIHFRAHD